MSSRQDAAAGRQAPGMLFLGGADIDGLDIAPAGLIEALEKGFVSQAEGRAEIPTKPTIHPRPDCFLRALPGYLAEADVAGLKWVSAYPVNSGAGLPLSAGLVILNDPATGLPLAVLEGNRITAWRTAGVSAVAARMLAPEGAGTLAICGAGVQGRIHLEFLPLVLPSLRRIRIFDPHPRALAACLESHAPLHPGLKLTGAASPQEAVAGAEVVVTAAPMPEKSLAILGIEDIFPGALLLPVDLDSYFAASAFASCDRIFSDDMDQLFALKKQGRFRHLDHLDGDYGQLLTGRKPGRALADELIMAVSVGTALGDLIIADLLHRRAKALGRGQWLEL